MSHAREIDEVREVIEQASEFVKKMELLVSPGNNSQ